jgi:bacterioferritin-associated ferredoxin
MKSATDLQLRIIRGFRMYVCVCNALKETDVRAAAQSGGSTHPRDVYASLGCTIDCGACARHARSVIDDARAPKNPALLPAE